MLYPLLSLALAVYNSKGIYALLLGSGVSRSAGVPTGWDIIIDLINKLRLLSDQSESPEEPEAWYRRVFGKEPDYSVIIDAVTQTSAERLQLLRSYFEPTEQEREDGVKLPSAAHRAIASLIAQGFIRVVVTTNFDRLLEQALIDVGVQPTVISTVDAIIGATPLVHSACTIVKVHGDYLDVRLRNTENELNAYPQELNSLLDRIFDEYGLIVCGWSGVWDVALGAAFERCSTHRYGTYWNVRGKLEKAAEKLVGLRRASVLEIADADSLFQGLQQKVEALADFSLTDPVSPRVAVAQVKRLLRSPEDRIRLHDFLFSETERVHAGLQSFLAGIGNSPLNEKTGLHILRKCEAEMSVLLPVFICVAHWGTGNTHDVLARILKRIGDSYAPGSGYDVSLKVRRYPAILLLYGGGLASVAGRNYQLLANLLKIKVKPELYSSEVAIPALLNPYKMWSLAAQRQLIDGRQTERTPLNDHIFDLLKNLLQDYLSGSHAYDQAFDWFEYLLGLTHCDQTFTTESEFGKNQNGITIRYGPPGRFIWKSQDSDTSIKKLMNLGPPGEPLTAEVESAFESGLCRTASGTFDAKRYEEIKAGFDSFIGMLRWELGLYF